MRRHEEDRAFCSVCGGEGVAAGSFCVVPRRAGARDRMTEIADRRRAIDIARMITNSEGEDACAIRAHLITMGWRAP